MLSVSQRFDGPSYLSFLKVACASPILVLFEIAPGYGLAAPEILATVADAHQELIHLKAPCLLVFNQEMHRALAKFTDLHTAHFMAIDTALFRHLAALPNLRALCGRFDIPKPIMNIPGAFPALQELSTEDLNNRTDFLAVLPVLSSKSLTHLSHCISVPLTGNMLEYLDELCSSTSLVHLRKLELHVEIEFDPFDDEPFEGVRFAGVLALLKRLPGLKDIWVVVVFQTPAVTTFDMTDKDLDAVASAWPDLARVKLGHIINDDDNLGDGPCLGRGISRPSLSAVVSLAERCRKLESLDIEFETVDAGELARLEARADAAACACASPQTELRGIAFDPYTDIRQKLRVADPSRLAVALRKLFPNLVGGLEMLKKEPRAGERSVTYRHWLSCDMDTDAFRLLKALDDLHLGGSL